MATWLMLQAIELARKGEIEPERTFDPSRAPYTLFPDEE
jgi:hypothetical protein